ncbi:type II secretion system protein N [Oceanicoccus sp. KOV_DT_Chl]|uniref:type II secretion system protein N n=1 Tax=Oceanicoccus sp. KOV_DT_Chl TaxID=1904639 RepID=UPI000C7B1318|nr:type II secretion system protein N [Oceanicoccus sp. KOV_DT_Chl]
MKWFLGLLIAAVVVVALAVRLAPASLLPLALAEIETRQLLPPNSPRLLLAETQGTVWQGSAQAQLTLDGVTFSLGQLSWQLDAFALLDRLAVLQVKAIADDHRVSALVVANEQGEVRINNLEGRFPISKLEPWIPMLVKGDIAFVVGQIVLQQQRLTSIDGVLNLEYVDWLGGDRDMPLGSYMAQIYLQQDNVQFQLNDFAASLGLDGLLSVAPSGVYTFKATLIPRQGLAPEVIETIAWLGRRGANGEVTINKRGRF